MTYQYEVFPLFSSPVCSMIVQEDLGEYYEQLKNCDFFENTGIIYANKTFMSVDRQILDSYSELKTIILKYFNLFKDDVFHYSNTEFEITTSWMTKCYKNSYSQSHCHHNSYFSGVLYFEDYSDESSIVFRNYDVKSTLKIDSVDCNIFNQNEWKINVSKNKILFFPSYLYHNIDFHYSENIRYSLAFNLLPIGVIGTLDSAVNIQVKKL